MTTGQLSTQLIIQADHTPPGQSGRLAGQPWREPADIATVYGDVRVLSASEAVADGGVASANGRYRVMIHRRRDVSRRNRLVIREDGLTDRVLNIVQVQPARGIWLSLICEEVA